MKLVCGAIGIFSYFSLDTSVSSGGDALGTVMIIWWGTWLALGCFTGIAEYFESDPNTGKVRKFWSWRGQSWSFLFGGPLLIVPALIVTSLGRAHRPESIPTFTHHWWWGASMWVVAFFGFGPLFRAGDSKRWKALRMASALNSPTKWWIDRIQMPAFFGVLVTRTAPMLGVWDAYSIIATALVGAWIMLAVLDFLRGLESLPGWAPIRLLQWHYAYALNPRVQHVKWDEKNARVLV